jgi:hypothetical protein
MSRNWTACKLGETKRSPFTVWRSIDPVATTTRLGELLSETEAFVSRTHEQGGGCYLKDNQVVRPDPERPEKSGRLTHECHRCPECAGETPNAKR